MNQTGYYRKVSKYDGQTVFVEGEEDNPYLELGNYLGGGAAGVVYEAVHSRTGQNVALKILNPVGYKLAQRFANAAPLCTRASRLTTRYVPGGVPSPSRMCGGSCTPVRSN